MAVLHKFFVKIRSRLGKAKRQHPMVDPYKLFVNIRPRSRRRGRLHSRETCFIESDYMLQNGWYRGCIQNIGAGGAYVQASESCAFSPGEEILLIARNGVLREQLRGKIVWVGLYGMGVKFLISELDYGKSALAKKDYRSISEKDSEETVKIKSMKVRWEPSRSADVVTYRLYWSTRGAVHYDSNYADIGNATEVKIPDDIPSFPLISGAISLGISAISGDGNESDLTKATFRCDFKVPEAPRHLNIEDM
jgi:hypothetical protein